MLEMLREKREKLLAEEEYHRAAYELAAIKANLLGELIAEAEAADAVAEETTEGEVSVY